MDLTKKIGMWLHDPAQALGHLHEIAALGFDYVLVKILEGRTAYEPNLTRQLIASAAYMNLSVVPWMYARPGEAQAAARNIAALMPEGAADLVVDAEKEFECGSCAVQIETLLHDIAMETGHKVSLHLSSYWSPNLHPKFPFSAAMLHCKSFMPQAYFEGGSRTATSILSQSLSQAKDIMKPSQPVIPTINHLDFVPLLKAKGVTGFNVYVWDSDGDARVSISKAAWELELSKFRS